MTAAKRQLRFGAFFSVPGCHPTGWRHPDAICETDLDFRLLADMARMAERGKLDCMFFQDSVAIPGSTAVYGAKPFRIRNGRQAHIEPVSAIAALAAITKHIGLVSTCTTSYNEPYNVARRFLTIDHISGGRAGWNLVTSQAEDEAVNFGRDQHFEHGIRYDRAAEFHDVVIGLWDSWEDDAFLRDKQSGMWFDYDKMHILRHKGPHFTVRGPLNVARSPQGRPVVAQAGSSDVGMELAARTADMVFTAQTTIKEGQDFCNDMRTRMAKYGRGPEEIRIFPGIMPIVGRTEAEAQEKYEELRSLVDDTVGIAGVARLAGGVDIFACDPDGPLRAEAQQCRPRPPGDDHRHGQTRHDDPSDRPRARHEPGPSRAVGHAEVAGRRHAGLAGGRRLRRLQPSLPALSQATRGMGDDGHPRAATPRHLPHRVRGQDLPRESRRADPEERAHAQSRDGAGVGGSVQ